MKKIALLSILLFLPLLNSCSSDKKVEGERIDVMITEFDVKASSELDGIDYEATPPVKNSSWLQNYLNKGNLALNIDYLNPKQKIKVKKNNFGKGNDSNHIARSVPVITEDKIFLMDGVGNIFAYRKDDIKELIWYNKKIKDKKYRLVSIMGGMAYSQNNLVVTNGTGVITNLDAETGVVVWQKDLGKMVRSLPIIKDNKIFVVSVDNTLYAMNMLDGSIAWNFRGTEESKGIYGNASVVVQDDMLILPTSTGEVFAVNMNNGKDMWNSSLVSSSLESSEFAFTDIDATPIIAGGGLFASSYQGTLAGLSLSGGTKFWESKIGTLKTGWIDDKFLYLIDKNNKLVSVYLPNGEVKWVTDLNKKSKEDFALYGPIIANGALITISGSGTLYFVSPTDGKLIRSKNLGEKIYSRPIIVDGNIFVVSADAKLIKIF